MLIAAFLSAQGSALAHQVWHQAAGHYADGACAAAPDQSGKVQPHALCELHSALGTVLGAMSGAAGAAFVAVDSPVHFFGAAGPAPSVAALAPSSRGPPALS